MSHTTKPISARRNSHQRAATCCAWAFVLIAAWLTSAAAQTGGNSEITRSTITNGGDRSAGGAFVVFGTIGQTLVAGPDNASSGGQFFITGGFWSPAAPANPTPTPTIVSTGALLVNESCAPANGVIDPGERVTVHINLMNNGATTVSNLVAQLQPGAGVLAPSNSQSYDALAPTVVSGRDFSFTADPTLTAGQTFTAVLRLQDGIKPLGMASINFTAGPSPCPAVRLVIASTPLERTGDIVTTTITVQNLGNLPADNVTLTAALLGSASGVILLPDLNTISIGSSATTQVSFTTSATGTSTLKFNGTYGPGLAGSGSFNSTRRTTIP